MLLQDVRILVHYGGPPYLPATTLVDHCYDSMFSYCTKLRYIGVTFTKWYDEVADTADLVSSVSTSCGTFDAPVGIPLEYKKYGDRVPENWNC